MSIFEDGPSNETNDNEPEEQQQEPEVEVEAEPEEQNKTVTVPEKVSRREQARRAAEQTQGAIAKLAEMQKRTLSGVSEWQRRMEQQFAELRGGFGAIQQMPHMQPTAAPAAPDLDALQEKMDEELRKAADSGDMRGYYKAQRAFTEALIKANAPAPQQQPEMPTAPDPALLALVAQHPAVTGLPNWQGQLIAECEYLVSRRGMQPGPALVKMALANISAEVTKNQPPNRHLPPSAASRAALSGSTRAGTRGQTGGRKVSLTPQQRAFAKRNGMTEEAYAESLLEGRPDAAE